ncbi:c-type cytochrome [Paenibacillus thalictri]|uniref:Cytochrome c n=1 Tax=Paenibacillus thalictri TaxID=2527873 RepID=A0A4Q9DHC2_9BACL|nr:cytochrome c [Paenibacillus thalictri]TBL71249.1 cytochrome c [Paenibacillus thalictri]
MIQTAALLALTILIAAGCGGQSANKTDKFAQSGPGELLNSAPERAQEIYKTSCLSCHGNNLEGRVGPKTNLQQIGGRMNKDQITKQITNGGGGMPAFGAKLKPEDITVMTEWLSSLNAGK